MSKTYYRIKPKPWSVSADIDLMTGEQVLLPLNTKFADRKTAEKWCAVLNDEHIEEKRGPFRVIRCKK